MLKQYRIYRSIAAVLVAVLALSILSLSLLLYAAFSGDMQAELGRMAAGSMTQVAFVVGDLQARATALSRQLIGDANVVASMFRNPPRPLELYRASRLMQFNRSVQTYVHCILILNGEAGRVYATCDLPGGDERTLYGQIMGNYAQGAVSTMEFTVANESSGRDKVLGFVGYSELSSGDGQCGAVAIGVRPGYIASLMRTVNADERGAMMLLGKGGSAMTHSDPALVFQNLGQQPHLRRAMEAGAPGWEIANVDGAPCLIAYAPVGRLGWTAVSVQPYDALEQRMKHQLMVTVAASLGLLALGALAALWATARAYRPVARTLAVSGFHSVRGLSAANEADYIRSRFRRGEELESNARAVGPLVRDALLLQLITDWQGSVEQATLHQLGIELRGPYYAVCLLSLDGGDAGGEAGALLIGLSQSLLAGRGIDADAVFVSGGDAALLIQFETDALPDWLPICFGELQSQLRERCGVTLSCSSGSLVTDVDALPESYRRAREKLAYRFFEGDGCLLLGEDYHHGHSAYLTFPQEQEAQLRHAVQDGGEDAMDRALGPCVEHMRALTPEGAVLFAHQLLIGMLRKLPSIQASGELQSQYMRALEDIRDCRHVDQVADVLRRTLRSMAQHERGAKATDQLDPQVAQMLAYIRDRYTDPAISLAMVSAELNRSSAYLGRLFRTQVGRSFSESLGLYRTERAAELLLATDDTLPAICARVGIANSNYFYTQFKKIYDCTPQTYRSARRD